MFKVPSTIPQDLLLIRDLVSESAPGPSSLRTLPRENLHESEESSDSESIDSSSESSSDDSDSEDSEEVNVVESLLSDQSAEVKKGDVEPESSSSESSTDDSDSETTDSDKEELDRSIEKQAHDDFEEDEDEGGRVTSGSVPRTKNEVLDPSVVVPDITEIDAQEPLEKVGEIMSIIENTVVVKGLASAVESRASERALDEESLLVFDDRKVLGYVYETFGPTYRPLYQVKFPSSTSIDKNIVKLSREVFHVPPRSHFVFPNLLAKMRGSDASNVHDEEVNEDEIEFSDDEAEAAYRQKRKRKREGYRESSVASSRFSTPTPSQMRDQELNDGSFYGASPFDEYGPYDVGIAPGPSRPAPLPYEDPYQDAPPRLNPDNRDELTSSSRGPRRLAYVNSRDRGHGRERGRGRGRGRGRDNAGRGGFNNDNRSHSAREGSFGGASYEQRGRRESFNQGERFGSINSRSLSPTSLAIARATGQYAEGSSFPSGCTSPSSPSASPISPSANGCQQQQSHGYGQFSSTPHRTFGPEHYESQQSFTQPHINPRFASLFGIDFSQGQQYNSYMTPQSLPTTPYSPYGPNTSWANSSWTRDISEVAGQTGSATEYSVHTKSENDEYRP